ncbi:hypothetical protein [Paramagnetospirillum magnetotacticum]|uniref:hypothetical protein n=1 Tax=Paramagnetospirillum magnetotacticum TaxID=188 RepID=UPI00126A5257|nr:hypothetical protein [Paramagnetospirillum magnetotacticum]
MSIMKRKEDLPLTPGTRFEKVGLWGSVWTVEDVFRPHGLPNHARLVETNSGRRMTVAESVLRDPECFAAAGVATRFGDIER